MKGREMFIAGPPWLRRGAGTGRCLSPPTLRGRREIGGRLWHRTGSDDLDRHTFLQRVDALQHDAFFRCDAFRHGDAVALRHAERDLANGRLAVRLDDVDEGPEGRGLDGGRRHDGGGAQRGQLQVDVDELIREEFFVAVLEDRPEFDRPRCRVDLIVHRHVFRLVTVRITDAGSDLVARRCLIQVVMHPRLFFSASAVAAGSYKSVDTAIARVRAIMDRRLFTGVEGSGESRAA
jgi:hypothetical protein